MMSTDINESILSETVKRDMEKARTSHIEYLEDMEVLSDSNIMEQVLSAIKNYDYNQYTEKDVRHALDKESRGQDEFAALL